MKKIRVAVVGYGNIGKYTVEALQAAGDFEIAGIVRRNASDVPFELSCYKVVTSIKELDSVDVAILATPTRKVEEHVLEALACGINTVDSFDIHTKIPALRSSLDTAARKAGKACIISAGWDPGTDSMVRAILEACAPKGITYTNFGPGMSMGHSVAVKAIEGVEDALSMTIPTGEGVHRRMVYVQVKHGYDFNKIAGSIKADPYYASEASACKKGKVYRTDTGCRSTRRHTPEAGLLHPDRDSSCGSAPRRP